MKKILSLFVSLLIAGFPLYSVVAAPDSSQGGATAGGTTNADYTAAGLHYDAATNTWRDANGGEVVVTTPDSGGDATPVSCDGSSNLSGALDQATQVLNSTPSGGGAGGSRGSGFNLGGIVDVRGLIGSIPGVNSTTGRIITSLLSGQSVGGIANGLLGGGPIGNIAGRLLNKAAQSLFGATGFGNLLGGLGGAGGVAGLLGGPLGLVGGVLGGGEVPVSEQVVRQTTTKIQQDQDAQLDVTCVKEPLVAKTREQFLADAANAAIQYENTGRNGEPITQNEPPVNTRANTQNIIVKETVNKIAPALIKDATDLGVAQKAVVDAHSRTLADALYCPYSGEFVRACQNDPYKCGNTSEQRNFVRWDINVGHKNGCVDQARTLNEYVDTRVAESNYDTEQGLLQSHGYYDKIRCSENSYGTTQAECLALEEYTVDTKGINQQSISNFYHLTGAEQEAQASKIGELVDPLFASLAREALTSLVGLIGLSQNSGRGSYLNNLRGSVGASAAAQAISALGSAMQSSLKTETSYQALLSDTLQTLASASNAYTNVNSCYVNLLNSGSTAIDSGTAHNAANTASTTVTTVIVPQINQTATALTDSQNASSELVAFQAQLQGAQNSEEVNAIGNAYQQLVSSGALHNQNDLDFATNDHDASKAIILGMITDANSQLAQCKKY